MIALLQRVTEAAVTVAGTPIGAIGRGLLVFIGVQPTDSALSAERLLERVLTYRIFPDIQGRMNRSLKDQGGGLLIVPQFTLAADTDSGTRPSFTTAAPPALGATLFTHFAECAQRRHAPIATGKFGADMQVALINDGPATFWLEV